MAASGSVPTMPLNQTPALAPPEGVKPHLYGPTTALQRSLGIELVITFAFATITLGLRLYTRLWIMRKMDVDDVLITLAWGAALAFLIYDFLGFAQGLGKHQWDVSVEQIMVFGSTIVNGIGTTYILAPSITKLSILFMYFRINPATWFRVALGFSAAVVVAYTIGVCLMIVDQCKGPDMANCLAKTALAHAILNIITDVAIIALPIPTIYALHLPMQQKIILASIFTLGSSVIIASIARIKSVIQMADNPDTTHAYASACLWSTIEVNIGIVCNCLVVLKPFVKRHMHFLRFILGSTQDNNSGKPSANVSGDLYGKKGYTRSYEMGSSGGKAADIKVTRDYHVRSAPMRDDDSTEGIVYHGR